MSPAPQHVVDAILLNHSSASAHRALRAMGYTATLSHLDIRISQLRAAGKRGTLPKPTTFEGVDTGVIDAEAGCAALLRAMLKSYARKALVKGTSMEDAMLTSLYSPEQIKAWKAAA